jgi:hypothetical protein
LKDQALIEWIDRFRQDRWAAAKAYWEEVRLGIEKTFEAGAKVIPNMVAPYQAAGQDVMDKRKE